jgi:hypothetical protein
MFLYRTTKGSLRHLIDTLDTCSKYEPQIVRHLVNNLMDRIRKREAMFQFEILPQHLHGGTEENQPE